MTLAPLVTNPASETITIADSVPPEVQDPGRVRVGAVLHMNWIAVEIIQHLVRLLQG